MSTPKRDSGDRAPRFNGEVWREYELGAVDELIAEDFVGHDPGFPEAVRGPDGVREVGEKLHAAFSDCEVVEAVVIDGDRLAQRVTLTATHEDNAWMSTRPESNSRCRG